MAFDDECFGCLSGNCTYGDLFVSVDSTQMKFILRLKKNISLNSLF